MRFRMKILILELLVFTFESFGFDFEHLNGFRNCRFNLDRYFCTIGPSGSMIRVKLTWSIRLIWYEWSIFGPVRTLNFKDDLRWSNFWVLVKSWIRLFWTWLLLFTWFTPYVEACIDNTVWLCPLNAWGY